MNEDTAEVRRRVGEGRDAVAELGGALVDYLAAVQRVVEAASGAGSRYQDMVQLADEPLSEELGGKLRESVAQFARTSIAMATGFSEVMRTMQDAYEKVDTKAT